MEGSKNIEDIRKRLLDANDIQNLDKFYWDLFQNMRKAYNDKINQRIEKDKNPQTQIRNYRINKSRIERLDIELYIVRSLIEPNCAFCEALLQHKDYAWLNCDPASTGGGILAELGIDKDLYFYNEIFVDWNDRWATFQHPSYGNTITKEGLNYYYTLGLGIEYFPAMRITVKETPNKTRRIIIQGLGEIVTVELPDKSIAEGFFFDLRDDIFKFLENSQQTKEKSDSLFGKHSDSYSIHSNDPILFGDKKIKLNK